ncbi:MAG: PHP-associated domain-containing protein [bacterium]
MSKVKTKEKIHNKNMSEAYIASTVEGIFDYVESNFSKADVHVHTTYSDSASTVEEVLEFIELKTDLMVIAITDHDTISGAIKAQQLAKKNKYRFEVVIGEEVSTLDGHILGLFLTKPIPSGLSAHETIRLIHKQKGIAVAAHPFYQSRLKDFEEPVADGVGATVLINEKNGFDALEVTNGTPVFGKANVKAKYFNRMLLLKPEVGGSDAHIFYAIGKGYTLFEGKTSQDLRKAIIRRQTQALKARWYPFGLLKYAYAFLPHALRMAFFTMLLGPHPKKRELINFPSRIKIHRELSTQKKHEHSIVRNQ